MAMLTIIELLRLRGLDPAAKVKLVRHKDPRFQLYDISQQGLIEIYQQYQSKPIFKDIQYIVSFLGIESTLAALIGVYEVGAFSPASAVPFPKDYPYPQILEGAKYHYELTECKNYEDLKYRVVIDWGKAARSWHQKLREREVVEVLPKNYVRDFPGYEEILLTHSQLKKLIENPIANREWHKRLSAVAGIYLITDISTGQLYIGSAYGKQGILGRWAQYAKTGHGGNAKLKKILSGNPNQLGNFRYSILRTLPRDLSANEVITCEARFKLKLGSKAFGLNSN
jgi:hypothetical protein